MAKSANIVVVKINAHGGLVRGSRYFAALGAVAGDIASNDLRGKAVVSLAVNGERSRS